MSFMAGYIFGLLMAGAIRLLLLKLEQWKARKQGHNHFQIVLEDIKCPRCRELVRVWFEKGWKDG